LKKAFCIMRSSKMMSRSRLAAVLAASICALAGVATGRSETNTPSGIPTTATPNATINLIRLMVEQKIIPAEAAAKLIAQAEAEAEQARKAMAQSAAATPSSQGSANSSQAQSANAGGTVRVTYIPPYLRRQMVAEVRQEVMEQAEKERWAAPNAVPDWTKRWKMLGDMRLRYESVGFPDGNATGPDFLNVTSINSGRGIQVNPSATQDEPVPFLNTDQDRTRMRVRARLGAEVNLEDGFTSGFRFATGESNSPISQNQTLGAGTGNFNKYSVWIDRAYIKYESDLDGTPLSASIGRVANPFFSTSMIWSNDVGFDGLVVQGEHKFSDLKPFATVGLFPVYNTAFDFSTNQASKSASYDKWLYAMQLGTDWRISKDFEAKFGLAYYHFENVEGQTSSPTNGSALDAGDTDSSRLLFAQKGNTYRTIRNLNAPIGTTKQYDYLGLASPYHEIALTGRLDYNHFEPTQISLLIEVVQNLALDSGDVAASRYTYNNLTTSGNFNGGDLGYYTAIQVGHPVLQKRWDWNTSLGYRYVQTDAVVDGFADSDFGGGGTNVKGFTLGGNVSVSNRVWFGIKFMSSDEVSGPTYKNDTFQFDINGKF